MVAFLACSMGAQLAAIRYLNVRDLPTIAFTLVLTGVMVDPWEGPNDPAALRRVMAILAFFLGVIAGGLLVLFVSVPAALGFGLAIIVGVAVASQIVCPGQSGWSSR
jgi:uncharacterized membrane protein YoaK (UPF0700 family)